MTKRICHAGLCLAIMLALSPRLSHAELPSNHELSLRDNVRTRIVERAEKSSVNIHTEKRQKTMDVVFSNGKGTKINGMGTGIVIDERGLIVTNYHVVQDVEQLRVTTFDGQEYKATVLEADKQEDLAIIRISPTTPLIVANFGTSSDLMLGEDVIAIGNAYGYESSVTRGIISHRSRDVEVNDEQAYRNLIQIDAAINPGNSGGPLLNADGEVIGINVAIRAGAQRIGFAIPIDDARRVIARLLNTEKLNRTYHGLRVADFKVGRDRKLVIQGFLPDSPGNQAGLRSGDVIVRSGDVQVTDGVDLERSLLERQAGSTIQMVVMREGKQESIALRLSEFNSRLTGRRAVGSTSIPATPVSTTTNVVAAKTAVTTDQAWEMLGLRLEKSARQFPVANLPYQGGMDVIEVRAESKAAKSGIMPGDILVGMHSYETTKRSDLDWVLSYDKLSPLKELEFYIIRDGKTFKGFFQLPL